MTDQDSRAETSQRLGRERQTEVPKGTENERETVTETRGRATERD